MRQVSQRDEYFDFLKGIAILMVIAIHAYARIYKEWNLFEQTIRSTFNCAVPIFLAVSGFFLSHKELNSPITCLQFWKKQIPKIYIPGLIYQLPLYIKSLFAGFSFLNCTFILVFCGYSINYFVILILQYYLLLPLLNIYSSKRFQLLYIITSLLSITVVNAHHSLLTKILHMPLVTTIGLFPVWIAFFGLGIYLAKHSKRDYKISTPIILAVLVLLAEIFGFINVSYNYAGFIFSYLIILVLFSNKAKSLYNKKNIINMCISKIGIVSFAVYLIHCYYTDCINIDFWFLRWFCATCATLLTIYILKKILPRSIHIYFGLYS